MFRFKLRYNLADVLRVASRFKPVPECKEVEVHKPPPRYDVRWADIRKEKRTKSRGKSKGYRDWSKLEGIVLHQTATNFGSNPMRVLNVPTHGCTLKGDAFNEAINVKMHDPTAYMYHAGGLNRTPIGLEIDCRASGVLDDPSTLSKDEGLLSFWRPKSKPDLQPQEATDAQLEAAREFITYYVELVAANGGKLKYIYAHRQSSKNRVSDPGERIWKEVAEWAAKEHGLIIRDNYTVGDGKPLPDMWTERPNGNAYNWRIDGSLKK